MKILAIGNIHGAILAPGSKSFSQRAIVAALLAGKKCVVHGLDDSNDTLSAQSCAEQLANIITEANSSNITLNIGESGLSTRLFTPVAATLGCTVRISGQGSILKRPMDFMAQPLRDLGVEFTSTNHLLPVTVKGPFCGGNVIVDGSHGSQFISGMLFALAYTGKEAVMTVKDLKSKPYVDMTLDVMRAFGVEVENNDYKEFRIAAGQRFEPCEYTVEGDWSGASCILVAGAVSGTVEVGNLNRRSSQADKMIIEALERAGARIEWFANVVKVSKPTDKELTAFTFDATDCPDLFPALAVLATACQGVSVIKGANRLTHKESNRALAIRTEFAKAGVEVDLNEDDTMKIRGTKTINGSVIYDAWNDHRIAMATAILALRGTEKSELKGHESVNKSYREFWDDLDCITL